MAEINKYHELDEYNDKIDYKINNIVATAKMDITEKLDLIKISRKFYGAEYHPERFPGVIFRQDDPRATFLIFSTGKMVITGLEYAENAEKAVGKILKKMKKIGIKTSILEITIQNIVASDNLHTLINLNKAILLMESVMYEPEVFPGLIYNMKDPRAVFLLFSTGKFVCTGVKEEKKLESAIVKLRKVLNELDINSSKFIEDEFELKFL